MPLTRRQWLGCTLGTLAGSALRAGAAETRWLQATAYAVPKQYTNQGSGYFSIVTGKNGRLYVGCAKYGVNAYLVEFDPKTKKIELVVDCHKEIGTDLKGFGAQAKIHTRNNVGPSGKIYFATKQGYPEKGEKLTDYPGGYPMVYDPATRKTKVYPIPVKHHGIISITPDEARDVAYISTCDDARPIESSHFMILDLKTGKYRDLMDCQHMYAFIVVDYLGRAYHPILGGDIARYDPKTDKLERLRQTIDGRPLPKLTAEQAKEARDKKQPLSPEELLAHPTSHPINWDISPDGKTLYSVAMSGNQLFSYDLTQSTSGGVLNGRSLGELVPGAERTDCRALCVGPRGVVWAASTAPMEYGVDKKGKPVIVPTVHRITSYRPGAKAPVCHGPVAIKNPDYTEFTDANGKALPWHHGIRKLADGTTTSHHAILGVAQGLDGTVYSLSLSPLTIQEIPEPT